MQNSPQLTLSTAGSHQCVPWRVGIRWAAVVAKCREQPKRKAGWGKLTTDFDCSRLKDCSGRSKPSRQRARASWQCTVICEEDCHGATVFLKLRANKTPCRSPSFIWQLIRVFGLGRQSSFWFGMGSIYASLINHFFYLQAKLISSSTEMEKSPPIRVRVMAHKGSGRPSWGETGNCKRDASFSQAQPFVPPSRVNVVYFGTLYHSVCQKYLMGRGCLQSNLLLFKELSLMNATGQHTAALSPFKKAFLFPESAPWSGWVIYFKSQHFNSILENQWSSWTQWGLLQSSFRRYESKEAPNPYFSKAILFNFIGYRIPAATISFMQSSVLLRTQHLYTVFSPERKHC